MTIKKSVHPRRLPPIHPGLDQRIREAEAAELRGETPRDISGAQKIIRPTIDATSLERKSQFEVIGLIDPKYRQEIDGRIALLEQAPFKPGVDLDEIWDDLSEAEKIKAGATERFRLEMEGTLRKFAKPFNPPHLIAGRLDGRTLERSATNLAQEVLAFDHVLAADSLQLLETFVGQTHRVLDACLRKQLIKGVPADVTHAILRDLVHKLVYQELNSRWRAMGDRGIRRICSNIFVSDLIYEDLLKQGDATERDLLLMRLVHVHQDLGHTAYAARNSLRGTRLHRAYGARIFSDEINTLRKLLTPDEIKVVRSAVATHAHIVLPFREDRLVALVRAVDHIAPFGPYQVFEHLEELPGADELLEDLLHRADAGELEAYTAAKAYFFEWLDEQSIEDPAREDLKAAFRPFEKGALSYPWEMGAAITGARLDAYGEGAARIQLTARPYRARFGKLFDGQQEQFWGLLQHVGLETLEFAPTATLHPAPHGAIEFILQAGAPDAAPAT